MITKDSPLTIRSEATLRTGEHVPESGIFRIAHFVKHRRLDYVVMRRDEKVPRCPECGRSVSCEVVRLAPCLTDDPDFADSAGY